MQAPANAMPTVFSNHAIATGIHVCGRNTHTKTITACVRARVCVLMTMVCVCACVCV